MTIPDPIADVRTLLLADAAVAALVTDRVYHSELPEPQTVNMPLQAVVVSQSGGQGRQKTERKRMTRLDTACYGATLYESWQLHLAVREALETLARTSGSVKSVEILADGANARDPVKQWPVCFASYRVLSTASI